MYREKQRLLFLDNLKTFIIFLVVIYHCGWVYEKSGILSVLWFEFCVSLLGLMYVIINTFRYYLNRTGRLINLLNSYSYGVYIIHFVVVGAIAWALLSVTIPSITKYSILTISSFAASNLIVAIYKKFVQRIYKGFGV